MNVVAVDAEVGQLAVGKAVQFRDGFTVTAPVAEIADQVHFTSRFVFSSFHHSF